MQAAGRPILRVAVASRLRRLFDYLPPDEADAPPPVPGVRVRVPFGRSVRIGIVVETSDETGVPAERLRAILGVIDREPLLSSSAMEFLRWAAEYFHHPPGEVLVGTLPPALRRGRVPGRARPSRWRITEAGRRAPPDAPRGAPVQARLLGLLRESRDDLDAAALTGAGATWRKGLRTLEERGWVAAGSMPESRPARPLASAAPAPVLNPAQQAAVDEVRAGLRAFGVYLLDGVTGSGKTEVYLSLIEEVIEAGRQALVLIPEIGLSPQLVARFRSRLGDSLAVLHSGLGDRRRLQSWTAAREGCASVLVGTRSAVFTPLRRPGLVVVDEEHDPSFKQMDGFRYSARDLAVVLGRIWGVPVLLGSATPSLESVQNAASGRYADLRLPRRAGGARMPVVEVVDLRGQKLEEGVSDAMHAAIRRCLEGGEQSLMFVNRRGFAPVLICHQCGWIADCAHCDAHLVYHREARRMRCHYCGAVRAPPPDCPGCGGTDLRPIGLGTQRVAEHLGTVHPGARVARMDRDSTRRQGALEAILERVHAGAVDILVGTQMLAKGHHFPNVTLVGILDADRGLFGADFRSTERMAQLLVQVAGRCGRGERPGRVLVQTHHPRHPLLDQLIRAGYRSFAEDALEERRAARLPPHACMALLRAEAADREMPRDFLVDARRAGEECRPAGVNLLGPVPALMERRAGRYRAQLLVESARRPALQRFLDEWLADVEGLSGARRVRWSLDVDPIEIL